MPGRRSRRIHLAGPTEIKKPSAQSQLYSPYHMTTYANREQRTQSFISATSTHGWNFYLHSWQFTFHPTYCVFLFNSSSAATWHGSSLFILSFAVNMSCRCSPDCLGRPHAPGVIQGIGSMPGSLYTIWKRYNTRNTRAWSVWKLQEQCIQVMSITVSAVISFRVPALQPWTSTPTWLPGAAEGVFHSGTTQNIRSLGRDSQKIQEGNALSSTLPCKPLAWCKALTCGHMQSIWTSWEDTPNKVFKLELTASRGMAEEEDVSQHSSYPNSKLLFTCAWF